MTQTGAGGSFNLFVGIKFVVKGYNNSAVSADDLRNAIKL